MRTHRILAFIVAMSFIFPLLAIAQTEAAQQKGGKSKTEKTKTEAAGANPVVEMKTSMGAIRIELFKDKAPVTVENFLRYVKEKFYDKTVFHRVINSFMIQGGGFAAGDTIHQKTTHDPIVNESKNGLKNERGTLAMARTPDPNSATSQFFINVVDNNSLNPGAADPSGYAVFGKVIQGMDIVDKIRAVPTAEGIVVALNEGKNYQTTFQNVPIKQVVVESVRLVSSGAQK